MKVKTITKDFLKKRNDLKNEYGKMINILCDVAPDLAKKFAKMSWGDVMDDEKLAELDLDGED